MLTFPMIATQPFKLQGRAFACGDRCDAEPLEAAMLTYRRKARFATPEDEAAVSAYRRQDEVPREAVLASQHSTDPVAAHRASRLNNPEPDDVVPLKRGRGRPRKHRE